MTTQNSVEEKMNGTQIIDFLNSSILYVSERLARLGDGVKLHLSILEDEGTEIPNITSYKLISPLLAKKYGEKEWNSKLKGIIKSGASDANVSEVLSLHDHGDACAQYLVGQIYYTISPKLRGEMEFYREYNNGLITKEFVIIQYRIQFAGLQHNLLEISANWKDSFSLLGYSAIDFERNPQAFIEERILQFKERDKTRQEANR